MANGNLPILRLNRATDKAPPSKPAFEVSATLINHFETVYKLDKVDAESAAIAFLMSPTLKLHQAAAQVRNNGKR